jgi:hypothetical protein
MYLGKVLAVQVYARKMCHTYPYPSLPLSFLHPVINSLKFRYPGYDIRVKIGYEIVSTDNYAYLYACHPIGTWVSGSYCCGAPFSTTSCCNSTFNLNSRRCTHKRPKGS